MARNIEIKARIESLVPSDGEYHAPGVEEAHRLMAALGIPATHLIEGAYVDLLAQRRA